VDNYKKALCGIISNSQANEEQVYQSPKKDEIKRTETAKETLVGNNKQIIMSALGEELYNNVYEFLKFHRRKGSDEAWIISELKYMVGGNRVLMSHCQNLDMIVYMEMMKPMY